MKIHLKIIVFLVCMTASLALLSGCAKLTSVMIGNEDINDTSATSSTGNSSDINTDGTVNGGFNSLIYGRTIK